VIGGVQLRLRSGLEPAFPFQPAQLVTADRRSLERLFAIHGLDAEQRAAALAAIKAAKAGEYGRKAAA
jgi:hypothetical protein